MSESLRDVIQAVQTSVENVASSSEELTASAGQTKKQTNILHHLLKHSQTATKTKAKWWSKVRLI
ncbi:hypothetical protein ACEQPO_23410 [Bacillus sp. SL00103]